MDYFLALLTTYSLPPIVVSLVIGVPSLALYIVEVLLLLTNGKKFDTAFYRLFLTRAIIHILNYFNSYVNVRFGRLGLFYSVYRAVGSFPIAVDWFLN